LNSSSSRILIGSAPGQQTLNNISLVCRTWQRKSNVAPRAIRRKNPKCRANCVSGESGKKFRRRGC